jgi:hypothetical protein
VVLRILSINFVEVDNCLEVFDEVSGAYVIEDGCGVRKREGKRKLLSC